MISQNTIDNISEIRREYYKNINKFLCNLFEIQVSFQSQKFNL